MPLSENLRNSIINLELPAIITAIQTKELSKGSRFDYYNTTLWHNAVIKPNHDNIQLLQELIQLLLDDDKTSLDLTDLTGLTPLHYALEHHNFSAVKILICNGANPDVVIQEGKSLIAFAMHATCNSEIIKGLQELIERYNAGTLPAPATVDLKLLSKRNDNTESHIRPGHHFFYRLLTSLHLPLPKKNNLEDEALTLTVLKKNS